MKKNTAVFLVLVCHAITTFAEVQLDIRAHEQPPSCDDEASQLKVTVSNVGLGGILTVELYNDPKNFLSKKGRVKRIRIAAVNEEHRVCFNLPEPGTYAVAAYHDEDANRKLNKKWNMMPKEPFGLSMNPEPKFGFPKFENSAFELGDAGGDIDIQLIDP